MIRICAIVEGYTEQTFIKKVIAPTLASKNIFIHAQLINTSPSGRGGALSYDRVKRDLLKTLKRDNDLFVTTFFDLYALDSKFPAYHQSVQQNDIHRRVAMLEQALHEDLPQEIGSRFIPHIQPYEFEALLFSDIDKLLSLEKNWLSNHDEFTAIITKYKNPELINGGADTHPSARLNQLLNHPRYTKVIDGSRASEAIGIDKILEKCPHFSQWHDKLNSLLRINSV
jgi:hypothetical protein